jgi:hypothetical protein
MLVTLVPIETLVRLWQFANAAFWMLVTVFGIVMLAKFWTDKNLQNDVAMLVTGRPLMLAGIVRDPPGPV